MEFLNVKKNVLGITCLVIIVAILLAGLWPFNFYPENKVMWLKDRNGIQFYGQGIIFSELPKPNTLHPFSLDIPFSIEILIQPDSESHPYLPRILSLIHSNNKSEDFFVGQWRSYLILRSKGLDPKGKWIHKEVGLKNALSKDQKRYIAITSDEKGTYIYVNGKMEKSYPNPMFIPENRAIPYQIILGNSPTGKDYWTGNLFGMGIYEPALSSDKILQHFQYWTKGEQHCASTKESMLAHYTFAERGGKWIQDQATQNNLLIPSRFEVLQKTILVPPWKDFRLNRSYLVDILINILGFIPFGFCFSAYLWQKKRLSIYRILLFSILLAGIISLSIELIQVYLPTRDSQLMDIITNKVGAGLGAVLFRFYHHKKQCNSPNFPSFHSSIFP